MAQFAPARAILSHDKLKSGGHRAQTRAFTHRTRPTLHERGSRQLFG
jgi:hypothetical protein